MVILEGVNSRWVVAGKYESSLFSKATPRPSSSSSSSSLARTHVVPVAELQQPEQVQVEDDRLRSPRNVTTRGWFYDNFVKDHTMEAKLKKFKSDVASRNGFVGSLFDDAFKYTAWIEIHRKLTERNLQSIACQEAFELAKSNEVVLLDVRESGEFEKVHAENSESAPLFRQIQGNDLKANMRRFGYALITDFAGTERNPLFINEALEAVRGDKAKKVVVMCSIGGTLQTFVERKGPKPKKFADPERMFGRQSRSLKASYELQEAGFTNVYHLKDGVNDWIHQDLPIGGTST